MQAVLAVIAIVLTIFNPVFAVEAGCRFKDADNSFTESFYDAIVKDSDPEDINNLEIEGSKASVQNYKQLKNYLDDHKQCNSDAVAFTAGSALAQAFPITLSKYLKYSAKAVARSLLNFGVLDCRNTTSLALEYEGYVQRQKNSAEDDKFGSYIHGIIYGWFDLISAYGLKLENVTQEAAELFYYTFKQDQPYELCPSGKSVPDGDPDEAADCKRSDAEKAFAANSYESIIEYISRYSDPNNIEGDGGELAVIKYKTLKRALKFHGVCGSDEIAFTAASAIARSRRVSLKGVLRSVADATAKVLSKFGVLNCNNANYLSIQFSLYIKNNLRGNGHDQYGSDFGSYLFSVDLGYVDYVSRLLKLDLNDVMQDSVDTFRQSLGNEEKTECKFDSTSGNDTNA